MIEDDLSFYRRRIEQERSAADTASCQVVRDTHLELLELYTAQVTQLSSASVWQAPSPRTGRTSFSALLASTIERPTQVATTPPPANPFMLHPHRP